MKYEIIIELLDMPNYDATVGVRIFQEKLGDLVDDFQCNKDYWVMKTHDYKRVLEILKTQPWSINLNLNNGIYAPRPMNICVKLDNKLIADHHEGLQFIDINVPKMNTMEEKLTIFQQNIRLDGHEKQIIHMLSLVNKPKVLFVPIKPMDMPNVLISHTLYNEHFALWHNNEAIVVVEDNNKTLDIKSFSRSMEAKLFDTYLMFKRDIKHWIEPEVNEDLYDMCIKIAENSMDLKVLKELIRLYAADIHTETVNENPGFLGVISGYIYPEYTHHINNINAAIAGQTVSLTPIENIIAIAHIVKIFNTVNYVPTGNKDPMGLKKYLKQLIFNLHMDLADLKLITHEQMQKWIQTRVQKYFVSKPYLLTFPISTEEKTRLLNNEYFSIDPKHLERIKNIAHGKTSENIILTPEEQELKQLINTSTLDDLCEVIQHIMDYLDQNKILPYVERQEILQDFINQWMI